MTESSYRLLRRETILWLCKNGYPALPVAPMQDAEKYPARNKDGSIKTDKEGKPVPAFCGKNPSYLDQDGTPHLVNHRLFQSELPSKDQLIAWFAHPENGVGTLGGWNGTAWIDPDLHNYESKEELDSWFYGLLELFPYLQGSYIDQTHSGGHRLAVKPKNITNWMTIDSDGKQKWKTNFSLEPGGKHRGEVLWNGRFTVLAPTIGVSGNPYINVSRAIPIEIESLELIGIHPVSKIESDRPRFERPERQSSSFDFGSVPLEQWAKDDTRQILNGENLRGDRSSTLTTAAKEWLGWENWLHANNIAYRDNAEDLIYWAGEKLGLDCDRVTRILKTIDVATCVPACVQKGGDESAWRKVRRLDRLTYQSKCPNAVKNLIDRQVEEMKSGAAIESSSKQKKVIRFDRHWHDWNQKQKRLDCAVDELQYKLENCVDPQQGLTEERFWKEFISFLIIERIDALKAIKSAELRVLKPCPEYLKVC